MYMSKIKYFMEEKGTQALGIAFLFRMVKFSNDVEKNVIVYFTVYMMEWRVS